LEKVKSKDRVCRVWVGTKPSSKKSDLGHLEETIELFGRKQTIQEVKCSTRQAQQEASKRREGPIPVGERRTS